MEVEEIGEDYLLKTFRNCKNTYGSLSRVPGWF